MNPMASVEAAMASGSAWLIPLVFLAGLCTSLNPCVYPTIPVIVGFVSGQQERRPWRGLLVGGLFLLGLATTYALLGAVAGSLLGGALGLSRHTWLYVVAAVCLVVGMAMTGLVPLNLSSWAPLQSRWRHMSGPLGAVVLGLLFGLVATPCATPVLVLILAFAASKGQALFGAGLLFVYALGHGLPVLLVATITGAVSTLRRLATYSKLLQRAGGWVLVAAGLYLLWVA